MESFQSANGLQTLQRQRQNYDSTACWKANRKTRVTLLLGFGPTRDDNGILHLSGSLAVERGQDGNRQIGEVDILIFRRGPIFGVAFQKVLFKDD